MANPPPLPPLFNGPITTANRQVSVDNLLPNSVVTILSNGASVGSITTVNGGLILVPLTAALEASHAITATQRYTGSNHFIEANGTSDPSNAIKVHAVPDPLPSPIFASGLTSCADQIYMDGMSYRGLIRCWAGLRSRRWPNGLSWRRSISLWGQASRRGPSGIRRPSLRPHVLHGRLGGSSRGMPGSSADRIVPVRASGMGDEPWNRIRHNWLSIRARRRSAWRSRRVVGARRCVSSARSPAGRTPCVTFMRRV
jgi:hypothetical protein